MSEPARFAGLVLAAGSGSRFGGGKVRALLDGLPLVAHVLDAVRAAGIGRLVLVLGRDALAVRAGLLAVDARALDEVSVAVNAAPERGLATSVRFGMAVASAGPAPAGILVLLGDQPRVRADVIAALLDGTVSALSGTLAIVPQYADDGALNPVLLLPASWTLVAELDGDRGLGALLAARPERVVRVPVAGANPDVDTVADLAALEGSPRAR